jgi:hypothetical protein
VGGSAVATLPAVIDRAGALLAANDDPSAPELVASAMGERAVGTGAVEHALALVREQVFELNPGARSIA